MSHSEEGVTEDTGGNSPVFGIDQKHALKQRHKLPPVCLLCLHVSVIRTQHQVHLIDRAGHSHKLRFKYIFCEGKTCIVL